MAYRNMVCTPQVIDLESVRGHPPVHSESFNHNGSDLSDQGTQHAVRVVGNATNVGLSDMRSCYDVSMSHPQQPVHSSPPNLGVNSGFVFPSSMYNPCMSTTPMSRYVSHAQSFGLPLNQAVPGSMDGSSRNEHAGESASGFLKRKNAAVAGSYHFVNGFASSSSSSHTSQNPTHRPWDPSFESNVLPNIAPFDPSEYHSHNNWPSLEGSSVTGTNGFNSMSAHPESAQHGNYTFPQARTRSHLLLSRSPSLTLDFSFSFIRALDRSPEKMGSVTEVALEESAAAAEVVFRSKLPDIEIHNEQPLHTYCFAKMAEVGSRPCLIDGQTGMSYTYAEVEALSRRAAAGLRRMGVGKGDVVMNLLRNCPEFAFSFLGAARLGAAITTANPFYTPHEIHRQAAAAGAKVIVTEACAVDKVREFAQEKGVPVVTVDGKFDGCVEFREVIAGEELEADAEIDPDDVVALPYSSGTTGLPKGVMLTHRSLITSVAQQVDGENPNLYFSKEDVLLCLLPLFHIYSLNSVLLAGLRAGSAIVIMRKFDIGALVDLLRKYNITIAPFVPPIVVEIAKSPRVTADDLASIRMVMSGAAPMGKELQDAFMAKIPNAVLGQGYGMTEAGPVLAMCLAFAKEPFKVKSGSCGTVVRNAELKIVDPDTGASLGRNQSGEICIRGEQIMIGYLNDPESTKNTIDKDGWLHTGDIGLVDDDDEIFIVDRLKEIIKYKGFQVPPAELEALLITHPEIKDAAVVSMKDDLAGEVPVAFIVRTVGSEITEDEIKQFVAKEVVFYKRINKVFFTDSIPKNPSGKILRKDLRARLAAGIPSAGDASTARS